jgi:hypothetical protein
VIEKVYEVRGNSVRQVSITVYTYERETNNYLIVLERGCEKQINKNRVGRDVFTSEADLRESLRRRKEKELESAKRAVKELSTEVTVSMHEVPSEQPPAPKPGDLKL